MIRHIVHLRFAENASEADRLSIYDQLAGLSGHIDGILDFQHRTNVSVEIPLVRGFNDMFWFDFADETVRNAYLEDSVHKAIGAQIVARLEGGADGVFVCDIEV
ncbi:MAG: Dabb family protein [Hoeflea sp.]|uniref:Dabb family protein n=1 Tax=Hoeflea sp. TaxID=1940281 RepID=UPI001E141949|nr:Dabb family protein [Hoeflea sp.]MBU4531893.1 Dabb family protein [Alphaproteobacteria bacterium]MBU4546315.1 Dabb family protein [Alphaproteobacteria bacterium]MBU4549444.1 Dabb family protein [Alphaproteobacteria bacterium]MBV1722619.1 Dabb family protein [Hoeflea sp.]MBV1782557.1 Dabb family protein [Hoeflea sp.]